MSDKNKEEKKQTEYISVSQFKINERWLLIPDSLIANIERIDTEIMERLALRQEVSIKIGQLKNKEDKEIVDTEREKQLMQF